LRKQAQWLQQERFKIHFFLKDGEIEDFLESYMKHYWQQKKKHINKKKQNMSP
jgi:hypothetical protein